MTPRFRRKHRHPSGEGHSEVSKSRFGLLWVILAIVVLAAVIGYDRYGIHQGQQHISQAREYERNGLYSEALREYQVAYANKRLGRRPRAEVALQIGDIYYDRFENYDMAHQYFMHAKQNAPKLFEKGPAQERLKQAQRRMASAGGGAGDDGTTGTLASKTQLMSPPAEDLRGPVVAKFEGGEVRAGEILRHLRNTPEFDNPAFREDPAKLQDFIRNYTNRALRYEAALDAGIHRDPDIVARVFDYQRTLISERYATLERQKARTIPDEQVREYYEKNRTRYVRPATARAAMIKTNTESEAQQALERLRKGEPFGDVATTTSIHEESARQGGLIGEISAKSEEIPGVGKDADLVKALTAMAPNSVTGVTPSNGAFFIFKVFFASPAQNITLDEARPQIEQTLRNQQVIDATTGLDRGLQEQFKPQVVEDGAKKFWQFAAGPDERPTTTTLTSTTRGTTATAAAAQTTGEASQGR